MKDEEKKKNIEKGATRKRVHVFLDFHAWSENYSRRGKNKLWGNLSNINYLIFIAKNQSYFYLPPDIFHFRFD